jgi:hypothetical protein
VSEKHEKNQSVRINPLLPHNHASDYFNPKINQVAVEVTWDDRDFMPSCEGTSCVSEVSANIPSSELFLVHNSSCVIDCGFTINLPAGYKCRAESLNPSLFIQIVECPRFKLNVFNAGEAVRLIDRQKIAKIWIEPIYLFEWIVRDKHE